MTQSKRTGDSTCNNENNGIICVNDVSIDSD